MQPIQINVSVNIGVTPELNSLLSSLLSRSQVEALDATPVQKKTRAAKQQPAVENQPEAKTEKPEPQTETAEAVAPVETTPVETAPENKTYTEVDVREAMDRTRKRIEGENYKENPNGELYQKWHRRLTAFFKNTAALYGSEKPSTLPNSESRYRFIACCDAIYVKDDELVEDCPF